MLNRQDADRERPYWLAFSQITGMGPVRLSRLLEQFGSLEAAWGARPADFSKVLDSRSANSVGNAVKSVDPRRVLDSVERSGISIVTLLDAEYPALLAHIPAAPPVLYVKGTLRASEQETVAIVGTRRATSYGREVATSLASGLASSGVTVVSGLARGIDGFAHQGALSGGGRTIAVLASGVDIIYPGEHEALAERIVANGALISDYPPGTKPDAPNFPARNRIISGLARATVVIEAPARSGALITVDFAADQGRDVFVVPGNVFSAASAGSNKLLRDGARAVTSASDIVEDLGLMELAAPVADEPAVVVSDEERRLLALVTQHPAHIDEIVAAANMPVSQGAALMTMLELKGLVRNSGSQHYVQVRGTAKR